MSFRSRLTTFFVVIVILPMIGFGVLVFRLIGDSEQGKGDARANGLATAVGSVYLDAEDAARADAQAIVRNPRLLSGPGVSKRLERLARAAGLVRVVLRRGEKVLSDVGNQSAIAPGSAAVIMGGSGGTVLVTVSTLTAGELAHQLSSSAADLVVRQGAHTLTATVPISAQQVLPRRGQLAIAGQDYRVLTQSFAGFGGRRVEVTVLSNMSATSSSVGASQLVAAGFIAGFLLLAFAFSILASRTLQGQVSRFLQAARRLGGGDFSTPVPAEGNDDFAALGVEFNRMSEQLEGRLAELSRERAKLREAIRRIGQTFAANLDRQALLDLALHTALDAAGGERGRITARVRSEDPLVEVARVGELESLKSQIAEAEQAALGSAGLGDASAEGGHVASVALGPIQGIGRRHGVITVTRSGEPFSSDDQEVLWFLAAQATLALENIELHYQVRRQAVTDELTGLANHGRLQELLSLETEQVRRYHHPVGLIMLDIDNFKSVNDMYGHPQGDVVLKQVARVVRETSRDADAPARYGGEEMAVILPHTDLEGSYAIAERLRTAIENLRVPRLDGEGVLRITASLGVAAATDGHKDDLIAEADAALYRAKAEGKNRTVRALPRTANVAGGE
ncbi:MAG: diguanylate cyclase [Solirubrobacteraceae bacterium]